MANTNQEVLTILRLKHVKNCTGLSRSTIYLRIREGTFPRPVSLGLRAVGWPSTEVAAINAARIAGNTDEEIRSLVKKLEAARKMFN
jgi:prophage regulatory protein